MQDTVLASDFSSPWEVAFKGVVFLFVCFTVCNES